MEAQQPPGQKPGDPGQYAPGQKPGQPGQDPKEHEKQHDPSKKKDEDNDKPGKR